MLCNRSPLARFLVAFVSRSQHYQKIMLYLVKCMLGFFPRLDLLRFDNADISLSGTSREPDVHMWSALEAVQMKDHVQALPGGLDSPVAEGGGNLSVSGYHP